ncbi:MAG: DUF5671 domain-containing protein [Candidatus Moranbacteria bacterium]|nr:DUF5671 domain-containing protein [Candidatus Moranbacteria bacterium]MDD5652461.1 DUF5671 domain-containing protein [Candidatus Moranbacteria bacterium]
MENKNNSEGQNLNPNPVLNPEKNSNPAQFDSTRDSNKSVEHPEDQNQSVPVQGSSAIEFFEEDSAASQNENQKLGQKNGSRNSEDPAEGISKQITAENNSAMHFFMYMVSFFSLLLFSTGIGTIVFQIINKNISDNLIYDFSGYFAKTAVKYGIATILIAMPIYFVLMYFINKKLYQGEIDVNSKVRKWLTYIILFIASAIIIGDLITLVFYMLDGDMTARFILKIITVIIIAGFIFGYYLWDMKKNNTAGVRYMANKIFAIFSIIISIIVLFSSFFVIDSPKAARDKKMDNQTLSALSSLNANVLIYHNKNHKLPNNLEELGLSSYEKRNLDNLEIPITYKRLSENDYELCTSFKRETEKESNERYGYLYNDEWMHPAGNHCFSKKIENKPQQNKNQVPVNANSSDQAYFEGIEAAREKAQLASVKSYISSTFAAAVICKDGDGKIISGSGGSQMCDNDSNYKWPNISICGNNPESTKWIVGITGEGENVEWNITLDCEQFLSCNGSANAVCTEEGCNFSGTCQ